MLAGFLFCPKWDSVSLQFERQLISNSREMPKLLRGKNDKLNVTVGDHASRMMPETLASQTREIMNLVSFQHASRASNGRSNCELLLLLWVGERQREFSKEKHVRCPEREEGSLQKLQDTKRYGGFRQVHCIKKYLDKISVSVVCFVCPNCHLVSVFDWF